MDHLSTLGNAQNLNVAADMAYAKHATAAQAQYATSAARPPLTAELMQALESLYSVANETQQLLAAKHAHLFGHVPSAPGELTAGSIGGPVQPETYEMALSSRLRGLLSLMQDGLAIAQSLGSRL